MTSVFLIMLTQNAGGRNIVFTRHCEETRAKTKGTKKGHRRVFGFRQQYTEQKQKDEPMVMRTEGV